MKVFVSDRAFLGLVLSSIEVYKKECLGILLGYKTVDQFVVQYAIPYQSAERGFSKVDINLRRETKCLNILSQISQLRNIGFFHSQAQWGDDPESPELSDVDKENMREGDIEIVVAVNEKKSALKWKFTRRKELTGAIGDYFLKVAAYCAVNGKQEKLIILCPYALGFDYTFAR